MKDSKGFSGSIGGSRGANEIASSSIGEADGESRKPDPNKGAGSVIGPYGRVPVPSKDPKLHGAGPSPSGRPRQPK